MVCKMPEKRCATCKWHDDFCSACCNSDSEHCADFTLSHEVCEKWEERLDSMTCVNCKSFSRIEGSENWGVCKLLECMDNSGRVMETDLCCDFEEKIN